MAAESATRSVPPSGVFGVGDGVVAGALDGNTTADGLGVDSGAVAWHAVRTTAAATMSGSGLTA
jgi:hypothetical protein